MGFGAFEGLCFLCMHFRRCSVFLTRGSFISIEFCMFTLNLVCFDLEKALFGQISASYAQINRNLIKRIDMDTFGDIRNQIVNP